MVITDIKNTKIRVEDEAHSKAIQEAAFKLGFRWGTGDKYVQNTERKNLFFFASERIYISATEDFEVYDAWEIWFCNGEFHDKPQDELFVSCSLDDIFEADKAKHKLFEIGFIYYQGEWVPKEEIEKQKADEEIKEIAEFIRSMCVKHRAPKGDEISIDAAKALHEAGYRKGEL